MPTLLNVSFPGYPLSSHLSISISNCQLISTHNIERFASSYKESRGLKRIINTNSVAPILDP